MEQGTSMLQVLPQPRSIPSTIIWLIYGVILAGTLIAIIVLAPNNKNSRDEKVRMPTLKNPTTMENTSGQSAMPNTSWLCRSDDEISYTNSLGDVMVMNVTSGFSYPRKAQKRETLDDCHSIPIHFMERINAVENPMKPESSTPAFAVSSSSIPVHPSSWLEEMKPLSQFTNGSRFKDSSFVKSPRNRIRNLPRLRVVPNHRKARRTAKNHDGLGYLKKHQQRETEPFDAEPSPSIYISKNAFESVRVGESSWLIHTIVQQDERRRLSLINLAISRADILAQDMDEFDTDWIPDAGDRYRALLPSNQLYVTSILGAKIVDEGQAETFFIAAPIHDFSVRFLYRLRLDFPPLKFSTLGPLSCLTCSTNKSEEIRLGHEPRCDWSEVLLSFSFKNYILHCRGSKPPKTVVVSMENNTVIRNLDNNDELRKLHSTIQWPLKHKFDVGLQDGSRAKAVLYLPHNFNKTKSVKIKLLVQLSDHQDDQMVTAKFDVSIITYLVAVEGYAVLSADIRGSKFKSVDYIGMRVRRREVLQVQDYIKVIHHVLKEFNFIDSKVGFGIFGKDYGGHMALKLIAQDDVLNEINSTTCYVAINPVTLWQLYVNPFTIESSSASVRATRREEYINRYLSPMVRKMKNKHFALFKGNTHPEHQLYMDDLKEMMDRHNVEYQNYCYKNSNCTISQVSLYKQLGAYFKNCIGG
ncbi:hypothetical protein QAD02_015420 [Eretmocerus hayati]|uniref:Uncharacterized protein n=1 Tax=Eretmocerus hayati TaxID=131215 RepID=A0ACC2P964_9HYME|nr:hypothetical protein QAD02_015420 [Eretmocerus hayati]